MVSTLTLPFPIFFLPSYLPFFFLLAASTAAATIRTVPQNNAGAVVVLRRTPTSISSSIPVPVNTTGLTSNIASTNTTTPPATHFLTRLYHTPSLYAASSLTGRTATFSRPVKSCRHPTALFISSHCLHNEGTTGSIQAHVTHCREYVRRGPEPDRHPGRWPGSQRIVILGEPGACEEDEICVNGKVPGGWGGRAMASCVRKDLFLDIAVKVVDHGDGMKRLGQASTVQDRTQEGLEGSLGMKLQGMMASMVVSAEDGATPLKVDTLRIEHGDADSSQPAQGQICRDCVELLTPDFPPKTEFLTMEATAMTAGAAAGILWLAIMSG